MQRSSPYPIKMESWECAWIPGSRNLGSATVFPLRVRTMNAEVKNSGQGLWGDKIVKPLVSRDPITGVNPPPPPPPSDTDGVVKIEGTLSSMEAIKLFLSGVLLVAVTPAVVAEELKHLDSVKTVSWWRMEDFSSSSSFSWEHSGMLDCDKAMSALCWYRSPGWSFIDDSSPTEEEENSSSLNLTECFTTPELMPGPPPAPADQRRPLPRILTGSWPPEEALLEVRRGALEMKLCCSEERLFLSVIEEVFEDHWVVVVEWWASVGGFDGEEWLLMARKKPKN